MSYMTQAALSNGLCPCCGQPMPQLWHGIRIFPQSARILHLIEGAGREGIMTHALFEAAYRGTKKPDIQAINAHVSHVRKAIRNLGYDITCKHHGPQGALYKLVKVVKLQAFE